MFSAKVNCFKPYEFSSLDIDENGFTTFELFVRFEHEIRGDTS